MERMFRGYREERGLFPGMGRTVESEANGSKPPLKSGENVPGGKEAAREAYEERAAILEFDAGLPREEAERLAREMTSYRGW